MHTNKRLTNAYKHAKLQYFDDQSKYVFFSDSHRGDDSVSDEFSKNRMTMLHALSYYYRQGFTYVEAGDGDELWEHKQFSHIRVSHNDIFMIMKRFYEKNRLVLLYGNHNIYFKNQEYVKKVLYSYYDEYHEREEKLFDGIKVEEALLLCHSETGQEILTVHGHQGDLLNDQLWVVSMFALRYFWRFMHLVGFRNPASPARNQTKRHKIEKNYSKWIAKHKIMLICGHTHRLRYPKVGELPYFNVGCSIHTKGITGIEIVNGMVMSVQWRILADKEGHLRIQRLVMRGPHPISAFDYKRFHPIRKRS